MNKNYSLDEIAEIAKEVIDTNTSNILLFNGMMGVGKTTLIKEICKTLGVEDTTSSPTFSLVNEYVTKDGATVYHFDFYRINSEEEALDMGIEDYFYSDNLCLIEWPEKVKNLLPLNAVNVNITLTPNNLRNIQLTKN
ncbi:tRNA (adenosine(37)-N6)-threonylcarbamoyltransferase complex ATPase subunit type 1 TsaE [Tenacibaculum amylolyticum]|uniref:tRNA (adenosine(37)-N6)-threonylcarbamoyltransferase complex ATPase subunit type 1 TsaE n=1 Tax=Tenacibaculum amylolyticum TaxID=104269 RepID=UPI00389391EA